jgi:hypothetical protein
MTLTDLIKAVELDRFVTVTTRAGRIFTGAITESPDDCVCLMESSKTRVMGVHGQTFTTIRLDEIAAFTDHRDADGEPLFYTLHDRTGAGQLMRADHAQDIYVPAKAQPLHGP